MLSSILLHFSHQQQGEEVIEVGVELARISAARVRGLTLVDTRRMAVLSASSESAVFSQIEDNRLSRVEAAQDSLRSRLTRACLAAGIDFDLRRIRGNPFEVLPSEATFHDLVITSFPGLDARAEEACGLTEVELVDLAIAGVQPLLILRRPRQPLRRVLLATDGSPSSVAAVRQFLSQRLLPEAEFRLLAFGRSQPHARATLRELTDYCRGRRLTFESGWLCGAPRRLLVPYAQKWNADLVVWGVPRGNRVVRRLLGGVAEMVLQSTDMALYTTA